MNQSSTIFDVIILGSGPSGLTAALYTSRALLKTLVIGGNPPGGQLTITSNIENFPGFPDDITGRELISRIRKQAQKFGSEFVDENATKISGSFEETFTIETDCGNVFKSRSVIIATGSSAKWMGIDSEKKLVGKGVSACATCDGFFFKDKVVAVVGGGDSAMEEATYLTRFASKIYVLVRRGINDLRASKIMQKKAFENPKIEFLFKTFVTEILGENEVEGIKVIRKIEKDGVEVEEEVLMSDVKGLFLAIGHQPDTDFLSGFVETDELGYIKTFGKSMTSKEGVFASGDVQDTRYRQAASASGFGCMAAIETIKFLAEHGVENRVSTWD